MADSPLSKPDELTQSQILAALNISELQVHRRISAAQPPSRDSRSQWEGMTALIDDELIAAPIGTSESL
jgi:hypothetical protein